MGSFVLGVRLLLAAVFATAAVGKLLDRPGSRRGLAEFGVPARAAAVGAVVLPLVELATAVALLLPQSARWGAVAALMLLLAFVGGIARAMSRGRAPDCHCFGQIHSAPAGPSTLVRNGALAVLAAVVVWRAPGPAIDDWVSGRTSAELVAVGAAVAAAVLGALAVRLWLDNRKLGSELDRARSEIASLPLGLPVGADAPSFALADVQGRTVSLDSLCARGRPVALVFMSPGCEACKDLLPDVARWQTTLAEDLTVTIVSNGSSRDNRPIFEEHAIDDVLLQDRTEVMNDYRLRATPAAIVVSPDGKIASAPAEGAITIEPLVRLTLRRRGATPAARQAV